MQISVSAPLKAAFAKIAKENGTTPTEEARRALIFYTRTQGRMGSTEHMTGWDATRAEIAEAEKLPPDELTRI